MSRIVGVDVGTAFFQTAEKKGDSVDVKIIRNAFVELSMSEDIEQVLAQNSWQYVKDDKNFFVIGEDAMRVAKMFPGKVELRRPMAKGVLNKEEDKKMIVIANMLESSIGKAPDDKSVVCTCVSSESIDEQIDNTFHKARLEGMLKRLNWSNVKVIEEGLAVILSERPVSIDSDGKESPYSGIGISFGGGKANCVLSYKGLPVIGMSTTRGGDWIDKMVAEQTGNPIAQVTSIKESKLDFNNVDYNNDIVFALDAYYTNMIEYTFKKFGTQFQKVKSQFDGPLEIVLAGGTSTVKGFKEKVESVVAELSLPFKVKSIRMAKDPRNAVVLGCLVQAGITQKKILEAKVENLEA